MSPQRLRLLTDGPFLGMRSVTLPSKPTPGFVYDATNMVPVDPVNGGAYVRRPSDVYDTLLLGGTSTAIQWIGILRRPDGTVLTVIVAGGQIYSTSNMGTAFSLVVTTANLTTAGITLSASARCFAVQFTDDLVLHDGTNRPFTWDGTSGAGGLVSLTNAPATVYGKPTVYFGKLFFIKATATSDRDTIVWSEENAANTGYEASGFNNAWRLSQSGAGQLYGIAGTNQALIYIRAASYGLIRGAVSTDFSSAGVHDDGSIKVGTTAPHSVLAMENGTVYFADDRGRPWAIAPNGGAVPLWEEIADLFRPVNQNDFGGSPSGEWKAADIAVITTVPVPFHDGVIFWYPDPGSPTALTRGWLFSQTTHRCLSKWTGTAVSVILTGAGWDSVNVRNVHVMVVSSGGNQRVVATPANDNYTTYLSAATASYNITFAPLGGDQEATMWHAVQADVKFDVGGVSTATPTTTVTLSANTAEVVGGTTTSVGDLTLVHSSSRVTQKRSWGLNRQLRFIQLAVAEVSPVAASWGVERIAVQAYAMPMYPAET